MLLYMLLFTCAEIVFVGSEILIFANMVPPMGSAIYLFGCHICRSPWDTSPLAKRRAREYIPYNVV
jgi:hypothetical protein